MDAPDAATQVEGVGWAGRWFMRGEGGAGCWEEGGAFSSGEEARPPGGCLLRQGQEISSGPKPVSPFEELSNLGNKIVQERLGRGRGRGLSGMKLGRKWKALVGQLPQADSC